MPNMTTIESTQCYAAALDFLAQRYSKPGMRIAHWIIHNEVDGGSHWTNMGDKPIATFMDTYLKILLIKIISYSPIHIRNISRLLRKMHKICNRNIYCSTADS